MVWWIVAGVTVGALVVLVVAVVATGARLVELQRVADLAARRVAAHQQRLQARAATLQAAVAGVDSRTAQTRRRLARWKRPDVG